MFRNKQSPPDFYIEELTWREQDVLVLLTQRLTNPEIAAHLNLAESTVKEYVGYILAKLQVSNRRQAVERAKVLGLLVPVEKLVVKSLNNLPKPVTSFIGRSDEIERIKAWFKNPSYRLLTLTGPPGTGKTRLAIQAAADMTEQFNNGVIFISLANISDPDRVPKAIAKTLGIEEIAGTPLTERIKNHLHNKKILLILDNFEQVIQAANIIVDLLVSAPGLKVVVTSREVLRVSGEQELFVPTLPLPSEDQGESLAVLTKNEAVTLFLQRVRAVEPDFSLTESNASTMIQIVRKLDGLPLAIELAAPHIRMFPLDALLDRLECRFDILINGMRDLPARQQALRAAIDWSYDLLEAEEQLLLLRLSVFRNSLTIEAVETMCCPDLAISVFDGLESLLNKNLLKRIEGPVSESRFALLESIQEYAEEKLEQTGKKIELQAKHAAYFTTLAERVESYTRGGPNQMYWLRQLEVEHGNLQAALEWTLEGGGDQILGLRLVGALGHFWFRQGHYFEGQEWTAKALEVPENVPITVRAALLRTKALLLAHTSEHHIRLGNIREVVSLYEKLGDRRETGWALLHLSLHTGESLGKIDEALILCKKGLALLREVGDQAGVAQALNILGELGRNQGDLELAESAYQESLSIACEIGDTLREALQVINLGFLAHRRGQTELAIDQFLESISLGMVLGHKPYLACSLYALAGPLGKLGHTDGAARLVGAANALNDVIGVDHQPTDVKEFYAIDTMLRQDMGIDAYNAAVKAGRGLSLQEAVALAIEESDAIIQVR